MSVNLNYILQELAGGGYSDWDKLDEYIEDYEVSVYDIVEEAKEFSKCPGFNDLMYETLYLGMENMRKKVLTTIKEENWQIRDEIVNWIQDVENENYVNYLDSFIETPVFNEYDMTCLKTTKQVAQFIADVWKEIK